MKNDKQLDRCRHGWSPAHSCVTCACRAQEYAEWEREFEGFTAEDWRKLAEEDRLERIEMRNRGD